MSSDRREVVRVEIASKDDSFRRKVNEKLEFTEKVDIEIFCFAKSSGENKPEGGGRESNGKGSSVRERRI